MSLLIEKCTKWTCINRLTLIRPIPLCIIFSYTLTHVYTHQRTRMADRQRTLVVGESITVKLVPSLTCLGSVVSGHTKPTYFRKSSVKYTACCRPFWIAIVKLDSNHDYFVQFELVKLETGGTVIIGSSVSVLCLSALRLHFRVPR